jgi:hypothetical protein
MVVGFTEVLRLQPGDIAATIKTAAARASFGRF